MMKDTIIFSFLIVCLVGFCFGAFNHWRFMKAGGQPGIYVLPKEQQSDEMRALYRGMLVGYGLFCGSIAVMVVVAGIWGPAGA